MNIKFVTMSYRSTTTDDEIQTKLNGICHVLEKNGYSVVSTQLSFDSKHSKILFTVSYN